MITHKFEEAGLGIAPFRLVRVEIRRYKACNDCPSQPGASCDYCGTGIVETCIIRDANGKEFKVGNECVAKTGDRGLVDTTKREVNRLRTEERNRKADEKIAAALATLETDEALKASMAAQPHPYAYQAERGLTLLDYVNWMMQNGGRKGRGEAAKVVAAQSGKKLSEGEIATAMAARETRLAAERQARDEAAEVARRAEVAKGEVARRENAWLLDTLTGNGDFIQSMREQVSRDVFDRLSLSPKVMDILADIYGKSAGRYNSAKYWDAYEHFWFKAGRETSCACSRCNYSINS